jgi:DNA polymerase (family 10)
MQGFFHFHTTYSDGSNSLEEMIIGASNRGYNYFAVCDHSKSAVYANGLNEQRIIKQKEEIKLVSQKLGVRIFHGIESDILINGDLDYERDFLQNFDFIVASVHSVFSLGEEEMTNRLIRAVENPFTDVLGHPSGRLLLARDSYKINFKKVIDACASNRVAIEINANPFRLDLDWRNIFYAREKECLISINPDAHSVDDINYDKYGIMVARKAGLQVKEVINCFSLSEFIHYLNRKVTRGLK